MQTFDVGIRAFKAFRRELGAPDVHARASVREVLRFIAYLSRNRKAASTISAYVNAVANYHKMNDWENPCEAFKVKRALKGAARDNTCPDSRAPITPVILAQLINALPRICQSKYEVSLFRAIFLIAFFGLFRIGELVCPSKTEYARSVVRINDVQHKKNTLRITLRFSKTDQTGKTSVITMKGSEGHKLCPVRALCLYAKQRGRVPGPLFVHNDNSFVSIFQFNAVLKSVLNLALPGCNSIKSHSFRIGGATNAIAKGIPYEDVQNMGRWRSHAARKYIRVQEIDVARLV